MSFERNEDVGLVFWCVVAHTEILTLTPKEVSGHLTEILMCA